MKTNIALNCKNYYDSKDFRNNYIEFLLENYYNNKHMDLSSQGLHINLNLNNEGIKEILEKM
jgi:hypothetical protein